MDIGNIYTVRGSKGHGVAEPLCLREITVRDSVHGNHQMPELESQVPALVTYPCVSVLEISSVYF